MKITAVTVSVNYPDFLKHTLKENHKLFDKWIVITDLKDEETVKLCKEYENVVVARTDVFYTKGIFNKYAGINEGLKLVTEDDEWILFLDSDIVLHYETRRVIENVAKDKTCIYGMDRLNCVGLDQYKDYNKGKGILEESWKLMTAGLEFGTRLVHHYGHEGENGRFEGWRPLGFFQLCYNGSFESYPQDSLGADHCDLEFPRIYFSREKRILIPELFCIHLESERANKGVNWYGRKSLPFESEIRGEEEADNCSPDGSGYHANEIEFAGLKKGEVVGNVVCMTWIHDNKSWLNFPPIEEMKPIDFDLKRFEEMWEERLINWKEDFAEHLERERERKEVEDWVREVMIAHEESFYLWKYIGKKIRQAIMFFRQLYFAIVMAFRKIETY